MAKQTAKVAAVRYGSAYGNTYHEECSIIKAYLAGVAWQRRQERKVKK